METIYHVFNTPSDKMEELKKALTTTEGLANWWTTKTEEPEAGVFRFHFDGGYYKDFKVIMANAERVQWECIQGAPDWVGTIVTFDMAENDGKMTIEFRHSNWKEQNPMFGICNYHWALYMQSLQSLVETGKGNPTKVN